VSELAKKKKLYMRDAAYVIAIDRVAQACKDALGLNKYVSIKNSISLRF